MEPVRRADDRRPQNRFSEVARFDFENASILKNGPRRRADTSSLRSVSQRKNVRSRRSGPFGLSFSAGGGKALSNLFSNKRRQKDHAPPAGLAYDAIPANPAKEYKSISTTRDTDALKAQNARESVREPQPNGPRQFPVFAFGQQRPVHSAETSFTFGPLPQSQTQVETGKHKVNRGSHNRGLVHAARQALKPGHSKKDSKDLAAELNAVSDAATRNHATSSEQFHRDPSNKHGVPSPHRYQVHEGQFPAHMSVAPAIPWYTSPQEPVSGYQSLTDHQANAQAYCQQAMNPAWRLSYQLPPIAEDEDAEQNGSRRPRRHRAAGVRSGPMPEDGAPAVLTSATGQINHGDAQVTPLADVTTNHGALEDANTPAVMSRARPSQNSSWYPFQMRDNDASSTRIVSAMSMDYLGNGSAVSSVHDEEMADAQAEQDRLSLAASQKAMAEVDAERESLRREAAHLSWCAGQEEEFGAYALAADQEWQLRNSTVTLDEDDQIPRVFGTEAE